ncbi:hypothetical protein [Nostoc linckia]|nr:hypothetical protein [Nostoc linckia]
MKRWLPPNQIFFTFHRVADGGSAAEKAFYLVVDVALVNKANA